MRTLVKVLENSTDYSLMNTTRHALYLPLSAAKKYEGKTAIEAFFWRFGDLAQAGAIYAGLHWFDFGISHFAVLNVVLGACWLLVAWLVSRQYRDHAEEATANLPPRLVHPPEDHTVMRGQWFAFELPYDMFVDPDEGDAMALTAHLAGGGELPDWLEFDAMGPGFSGTPAADVPDQLEIVIRATDFDEAWAEGRLTLSCRSAI